MNQRIQDLMGKTLDDKFSHTWDTMTYEGLLQFSEKFAELIVQECAKVLHTEMYRLDTLPGREVSAQTMETAAALLKKHFGVEE